VSPAELEAALCTRPGVQEAAIVGVKHGTNEYVRAFVVRTNAAITEAHVFDYIKERFAQHKWLSGGVYFIDQIPRTRSGKVVKRLLPQPELRLKSRL
jgi:acyl-coenzyme A synthetase/AMP-(fatty) acid ligase